MARSMPKVRILMVGLVLAGCAAGLVPVRDATQRFELRGVSVLPPRGDGWYVVERDDRHVMLTKGLQGPARPPDEQTHTLSAFVVTFLVTRSMTDGADRSWPAAGSRGWSRAPCAAPGGAPVVS